MAFDVPFVGFFLLASVAVAGLLARGLYRLPQFRDPPVSGGQGASEP